VTTIVLDSWTITRRDLLHWRQQPAPVLIGLLFPVMIVLIFGYLFGGALAVPDGAALSVPGGGGYREFLMPGMFAMTMLFGLETTFAAVATDAARGITDRFRSLPIAASAVLLGRALADLLTSVAGLVVLIGCGLAVGWSWHRGTGSALLAVALLLGLRFSLLWVGIYLGLVTRSPESVAVLQILVWPVGFLSNAFVAPQTMPAWLGVLAEGNPLSATVSASRQLFGNPGWAGDWWLAEHAIPLAVAWPVLITAVFLPLSVRAYRRLGNG